MVASDLYALKGLRLKNEAKLWVIIRPWTPSPPLLPVAGAKRGDWILRGQLYKNL